MELSGGVNSSTNGLTQSLAGLDIGKLSPRIRTTVHVVTHTAETQAQPRQFRLGLEKLTHAPLNFMVFP